MSHWNEQACGTDMEVSSVHDKLSSDTICMLFHYTDDQQQQHKKLWKKGEKGKKGTEIYIFFFHSSIRDYSIQHQLININIKD